MFNVTLYSLVVIFHVASAALLVGGGASASLVRRFMKRARTGQELGQWLEFARQAGRLNPVFGLTVLATGVFLGSSGWWSDSWFAFAAALWLMDAVLAVGLVKRRAGALGAAFGRARGELTPEVLALRDAQGWDLAIAAMRANNATTLFLMFQKPGLLEALSVFALVHGISFAAYAAGRLREGAGQEPVPGSLQTAQRS